MFPFGDVEFVGCRGSLSLSLSEMDDEMRLRDLPFPKIGPALAIPP